MAAPPRPPNPEVVAEDVRRALAEDVGPGDLTAALIEAGTRLATHVVAREAAVLCGRAWFDATFSRLGGAVSIEWLAGDGDAIGTDDQICRLEGDAAALLTGERTALNFLQTLSGTATATRAFVERVRGTKARILDTRKTVPGLRVAQKYAVRCGGGDNHRMGLFDAILVKENHIAAAGSITRAVAAARSARARCAIEVEVESLEELSEALAAGADRALLDHFTLQDLAAAVRAADGRIELEASGNVSLETVSEIAATGVDFISVGAITKHVRAVDFSMRFLPG